MEDGFTSRSLDSPSAVPPKASRAVPKTARPAMASRSSAKIQKVQRWLIHQYQMLRSLGGKHLFKRTIILGGGIVLLYIAFLWITLPDISNTSNIIPDHSSVILDRNGTELYRLFRGEDRTSIAATNLPEHMKQAIVAIEDERFYVRGCLDIEAIARAFFRLGQGGGASTITRQLARNALNLTQENILNRKLKELVLGCQLESRYTKDQLLELYLNWITFGQNAYGVELASQTYFGKSAKDLTLPESAILASLPKGPSYYSPYGRHVRTAVSEVTLQDIIAKRITSSEQIHDDDVTIGLLGHHVGSGSTTVYVGGRADQVLQNMQDQEFITEEQRLEAIKKLEVFVFQPSRERLRSPHFVLWVRSQVEEMLAGGIAEEGMLYQGGLTIETTLDWELQQLAEKAVATQKDTIATLYEGHNIALLAADPHTKQILAYVGNTDYADEEHDGKVDMARAPRQPGSSFKPFVYAAAFEKGYSPATILFDVKIKVGEDEPQNFDGGFWGLMNARRALGASRNIPAIQAFFLAGGEDPVLKMSTRLGAPSPADQKQTRTAAGTPLEYGWPLSLGAGETPLLEMVQAYATFADQGIYKPLASIRRIKDRHGNILYELDEESQGAEVLDPRIAYQITSVLSDASVRPNEYWQQVLSVPGVQSAAKTGTSNKCLERDNKGVCKDRKPSDLWTIGYTPSLVTGVWVGNADAAPLSTKAESLTTAAPIWKDFMTKAHTLLKSSHITFAIPPGIVQPQISLLSGQLPTECTPVNFRRSDVFLEEYAPSLADPSCVRLTVDKATGLLASDTCPKEAREERSFFLPTVLQAERWPQWEQSVIEWANGQMSTYDTVTGSFSGSSMPLPLAPRESCVMSPERAERPTLTILSPAEGDGAPYPSFQLKLNAHVGSSIREIVAKIDGRVVGRAATDRNFIIRVPRSIASEGNHLLEVTLTDQYYNAVTASNEFHFTEDAGGPTLRLLSPVSDQHVPSGSSITIQARADDQEGGIKYVQFFLNDQLLSTKPKEPFELPYTFDVAPGTYAIRALATDLAGNVSEDTVMVIVEQ